MPGEQANQEARPLDGYTAEVVEVIKGHTGLYGEIKQVMCKILDGRDRGRVIRRNVAGKVKKGDILRLPDTNREARPIVAR